MSALFGVYDSSGAPVDADLIDRGRDASSYRGSDAVGSFVNQNIGLGHRLLSPRGHAESSEKQPATNGRGLWVIADSRLDNRADLEPILDSRGLLPPDRSSDTHFILAAYELWGVEAPAHLLGDFAFALWDSQKRRFFCSRDPLGVRPLVYAWNGQKLLVASDANQLFEDPSSSQDYNLLYLAEFTTGFNTNASETPYRAVFRLPGGHSLVVRDGRLEIVRYWTWNADSEPLSRAKYAENAEAFRSLFAQAVSSRLRGATTDTAGSLLSGGLDSSSISAVAAGLLQSDDNPRPLSVFTLLFPEADTAFQIRGKDAPDESAYARAVIEKYGLAPHWISIAGIGPLSRMDELFETQGCPHAYPNIAYLDHAALCASRSGARVLLHGEGGDEMFRVGSSSLRKDLMHRGARALLRDALEWKKGGVSTAKLLRHYFENLLLPPSMNPAVRAISRRVPPRWLKAAFARTDRFGIRLKDDFDAKASVHESINYGIRHWVESGGTALYLDCFNRLLAAHGVDGALPFLDLRLLRYAASLPQPQKVKGRVTKNLLRGALWNDLPDKVRTRIGKTEFTPVVQAGIRKYALKSMREAFESPHPVLNEFVNAEEVECLYKFCFSEGPKPNAGAREGVSLLQIWRLAMTNQWLKRRPFSKMKPRNHRRIANEVVG